MIMIDFFCQTLATYYRYILILDSNRKFTWKFFYKRNPKSTKKCIGLGVVYYREKVLANHEISLLLCLAAFY